MQPLPVGDLVHPMPENTPRQMDYQGEYITLSPLEPKQDASALFTCSHGSDTCEQLWTYMPYGPFENEHAMQHWLEQIENSQDPLFFTVHNKQSNQPIGMVSFLNIVPDARRLELGHIWYSPNAQNTYANTEAVYLMLCETFDTLQYRRAEWKCDSLNARSRAAALRLGFTYEGLFRQHLIVKSRNRDTTWFSMLDTEWPTIKHNLEQWLYHNPDRSWSLTKKNAEKS